jgi:putative DNA primase/helicase
MRRPLTASSVSTAAIYRTIERYRPTFVLDEVDTWLRDNEEMRGVLCGGHTRTTAFVVRVGGDNRDEPQMFSTFAPKVFAGIKRLADTIEDRAIAVNMRRKLPTESVSRLREDRYDRSVVDTQRRCCRWSKDQLETLRGADPHVPPGLDDRASDNWRPLLAIAELAGGDWPRRGRQAAIALSGQTDDEAEGVQLLGDIRDIFAKEGQGRKEEPDRLASAALVEALGKMEERPWAEWGRQGKPITAPQLARLLRPFEIAPRTIAFGTVRAKGYLLDQFEDAFSRYLPGPLSAVTPLLQHESGPQPTNPGRYPGEPVTVTSRYFSAELVSVTAGNRYPSNKVTAPDSTKQPENQRSNGVTAKKAEKGPTGEDTPAPDDQEAF